MNLFRSSVRHGIGLTVGVAGLLLLGAPVKATPMGHLDVANCAGGGVTVNATTIVWTPPSGGGGCIQTGNGTSVSFGASSTLGVGVSGTILNLSGSLPVANFMTFSGASGLHFDLTGLGPGSANTNCAGLSLGQSCSAVAGSPFILTLVGATATTVTLQAFGNVGDGVGPNSTWLGGFTTQLSNMTPAQIQAAVAAGGSVTSTYSGDFSLTIGTTPGVPEPTTSSLFALGLGLVVFGFVKFKFKKPSGGQG